MPPYTPARGPSYPLSVRPDSQSSNCGSFLEAWDDVDPMTRHEQVYTYTVELIPTEPDGYSVHVPALPGVVTSGGTVVAPSNC